VGRHVVLARNQQAGQRGAGGGADGPPSALPPTQPTFSTTFLPPLRSYLSPGPQMTLECPPLPRHTPWMDQAMSPVCPLTLAPPAVLPAAWLGRLLVANCGRDSS